MSKRTLEYITNLTNLFLVASQMYKTSSHEEYVIVGNDVLMQCNVPSFVADFVSVQSWEDSEGREFHANKNYGNFLRSLFVAWTITCLKCFVCISK